jgi:Legume lectin domain/MBG domain/YDG domain
MHRTAFSRFLSVLCSKSAALFGLGLLALFTPAAQAQGPLNYFKNYFVTGDYAVGGVGLSGKAVNGSVSASINFTGVPCTTGPGLLASVVPCTTKGAIPGDVIAAFLYWQTVEKTSTPSYVSGSFDATAPANPFVGLALGNPDILACAAGGGTQSGEYVHVYRADVLKYLPINSTANVRVANGTQTFTLTSASTATQFNGATLVVVYRLVTPGNPRIAPLRSVVIYDGAFTGTSSSGLNQTMGGFYQASTSPAARMTQIVGNGGTIPKGSKEAQTLLVNGGIPSGVPSDPFTGADGASWDNYSYNISLAASASSVETQVLLTQDCLSWGAIVTSTNVQDSDYDGLLDIWEKSGLALNPGVRNDGTTTPPVAATFGTCSNYPTTCLNLPAMGASATVPDIFMQIDWMQGTYSATHTHNPQLAALNLVGAAFKAHGINLHFDVGSSSTYQGQSSPYIIPAQYSQGGNVVEESGNLLCPNPVTSTCAFPSQSGEYSVLGWKSGFDAIKNGDSVLGLPQLFAENRKDTFHYALFGHAIAATTPLSNPLAGSISGVGDLPGGDLIVTLGLWRSDTPSVDQVGTELEQAGTLMHELGHNLDLKHGGWNNTPVCMADYPSVMNYMYQVKGLTDAAGNEHIDYSYGLYLPMSEDLLSSLIPMGVQQYRVRYFGPFNSAIDTPGQASQVYCNGQLLNAGEGQYVALESPTVSTPDWSNGTVLPLGKLITKGLDINYDGTIGETFTDSPDWLSVNLQQVGARPNADGLSLNVGISDIGISDIGISDIGISDIGISDIGISDIGTAQLGQDSLGDQDYASFVLSGTAPATGLMAAVTTNAPPSPNAAYPGGTGNLLNWTPGATVQVDHYNVYRCNSTTAACTPTGPAIASVPGGTPTASYTDFVNDFVDAGATCPATKSGATNTCYNTSYTYFVTEVVVVGTLSNESAASNTAGSEVNHLFVIASNESVVYGSANPTPAFNIYGNVSSALATSAVTCVYPNPAINAGTYSITCSGPATETSGSDGVTYNIAYLTYTPGSLTITPRPITVTAAASTKVYDATTASPATPTITTGSLAYSDTVTWIETYDNKNVGTTHVMTPSGTVSDGNGGKNYTVTFVNISTGAITPAPLAITATTNTKTYNGTPAAAAVPTAAVLKGSDTVTGLVETYNTANAGTNLVLTVSPGYTVNDGNSGNNYTVTLATVNTGVISPAPVTPTIVAANKFYDGTATATITGCTLAGVLTVDTGNVTCNTGAGTFANANAGTWAVTATVSLAGPASGNYALPIPATAGTTATINPAPVTVTLGNIIQTYSGLPLMPTASTSPTSVSVTLTGAPQTNAGSYPVSAVVSNPNYVGSASALFTINPYPLTVTASGVPKNFDGTTNATVTLSDNRVSVNDTFTDSYTSATFASAGAGTGIGVTVTGISISGTGATNYTLSNTTATTTANISDSITLQALSLNGLNYGSNTAAPPVWTGSALQLTNTGSQTTSAWLSTAIPVASAFTTSFQFKITPPFSATDSIGDGFAFVIQGASSGAATLGSTGYGMYIGYAGIPNSIAIEFDTYYNSQYQDPTGPHIGIQSLGTQPNTPDHTPATGADLGGPVAATFADGNVHTATITYDGISTLSVYLDGSTSPVLSSTVAINLNTLLGLNGGPAFVGFTAATGGAQETGDILSWTWN